MKPKSNRELSLGVVGLIVLVLLLIVACAPSPTPPPPPPTATAAPTTAPAATAAPKAEGPKVGGTLVWAYSPLAYDAFDPQSPAGRFGAPPIFYLGSGLVTQDPKTGAIVPFLAESWKVSADGLTYEFKLKKNLKWHDGTPLTARDYAWSIQRHKDPALKSPTGQRSWGSVASAEASDDYTLILRMSVVQLSFLPALAYNHQYNQPVPKHAIEKLGNMFATAPVLSGPFKFKEMQTGVKIVLERNPDFNWGPPPYPGPAYIQNLEFREVREYATQLAGLESGEIDMVRIQPKDVDRVKATGRVYIEGYPSPGLDPTLVINVSKAPWDDVRVRKAINMALDRQVIIKVATSGQGVEMKGPVLKGVNGYWPGVEKIGYGFDLNQAKALMKEADYTPGSGGILEKDSKPLKFSLMTESTHETLALLVKEQLKALGIELDIKLAPRQELGPDLIAGKYDLAVAGISGQPDGILLMNEVLHSSQIGALNWYRVSDPRLDELLIASKRATNQEKALEFAAEAQKLIVEKAYIVPLYAPKLIYAINNRVKGVMFYQDIFNWPSLTGAYLEGGR